MGIQIRIQRSFSLESIFCSLNQKYLTWFIFLIIIHGRSEYLITMYLPRLIFPYTVLPVVMLYFCHRGKPLMLFYTLLTHSLFFDSNQFCLPTVPSLGHWFGLPFIPMGVWTEGFGMNWYIYIGIHGLVFYVALYRGTGKFGKSSSDVAFQKFNFRTWRFFFFLFAVL